MPLYQYSPDKCQNNISKTKINATEPMTTLMVVNVFFMKLACFLQVLNRNSFAVDFHCFGHSGFSGGFTLNA